MPRGLGETFMLMARSGPAVYPCCTVLIIEVINSNNSHCGSMLLIILLSTDSGRWVPPPSLSLRAGALQVVGGAGSKASGHLCHQPAGRIDVVQPDQSSDLRALSGKPSHCGAAAPLRRGTSGERGAILRKPPATRRRRRRILTNERSREVAE